MNIQAQFDREALDMLPASKTYIATCTGERAGHHRHVVLRECCNSTTALTNMDRVQLEKFDAAIVEYLKYLDINNN